MMGKEQRLAGLINPEAESEALPRRRKTKRLGGGVNATLLLPHPCRRSCPAESTA